MKKVNMSNIANKIQFIYGDECEKNTVGIVIFSNGTDYFFDAEYKNKMSNDEVEALLLRGATVLKNGKYYRPASFDDENVSFGGAVVNPEDIEVDLSGYVTKDDLNTKADKSEIPLDNGVKMIAHRGFSSSAPENTIPAFELAGMKGYWGAECDIQQTSDGYFILMHDETVDRTTNGTGNVSNMTLEQIKSLTVDIIAGYTNVKVPTLEEYLICCKRYNLVPVIEIKADINIPKFIQIIREYGMEDKCIVISFSDTILIELRSLSNIIKIQLIQSVDTTFKGLDFYEQYNFDVDINYTASFVTEENIKEAHRRGIEVNTWTVDYTHIMSNLINLNVDYITTNSLNTPRNEGNRIYQLEQEVNYLKSLVQSYHNDDKTINIVTIESCTSRNNASAYPASFTVGAGARAFSSIHSVNGYTKINITFDSSKYKVTPVPFNSSKMVLGDLGWSTPGTVYDLPAGTAYVCFYFGTMNDAHFTTDLLNEIKRDIAGHLS